MWTKKIKNREDLEALLGMLGISDSQLKNQVLNFGWILTFINPVRLFFFQNYKTVLGIRKNA